MLNLFTPETWQATYCVPGLGNSETIDFRAIPTSNTSVRTFNRVSENHARSELVDSDCVEILWLLRCYEVFDFLVLGRPEKNFLNSVQGYTREGRR